MSIPNTTQKFQDIRTGEFTASLNRLYESRVLDVNVTVARSSDGTYALVPVSIVMVDGTIIKYIDDDGGPEASGASLVPQEWLEQAWVDMTPVPQPEPDTVAPMSKKVAKDK